MTRPTTRRVTLALAVLAVLTAAGLGITRAATPPPRTPQEVAAAVQQTLRCPTCQGLSIADSPSPIAAGMRRIVEKKAAAGASPDQIRAYFVTRYGQWVLLNPPRRGLNRALWLLPAVAVTTGLVLAVRAARRRSPPLPAVDDAALARAEATYAAYRAGQFTPRPSENATEERVEATLELLTSIDGDSEPDTPPAAAPNEPARKKAMRRLAAALTATTPPQTPDDQTAARAGHAEVETSADRPTRTDTGADTHTDAGTPSRSGLVRKRVRVLAYASGAAVFGAALACLLITNIVERGPGGIVTGLLTGSSPPPSAQPSAQPAVDVEALRVKARNNPNDPTAWIALGLVLDRKNQLGEAYQAYRRALEADPANTMALQRAAWALIRGGEPAEAIPLLERAARRAPPDARSVLLLGLAQYGADRPDAQETLRRYLKLAPHGPMSTRVRALLEKP